MKKLKLFTLGLLLCFSVSFVTGCGNKDNTDNQTEDKDVNDNTDDKDTDANGTSKSSEKPGNDTSNGTTGNNIGDDVEDIGNDIADGIGDLGDDLTGNDSHTDNNGSSASPSSAAP